MSRRSRRCPPAHPATCRPSGYVWAFQRYVDGRQRLVAQTANDILDTWGWIAYQAIGRGNPDFKLAAIYAEFANVASPGDTVAVPDFARSDSRAYYANLSSPRDYLRLPVVSDPALSVAAGFADSFTAGQGNQALFTAVTAGLTGINGLPFSEASNSVVYGVALVATPAWEDVTADVLYGRAYYTGAQQIPKTDDAQIALLWQQTWSFE